MNPDLHSFLINAAGVCGAALAISLTAYFVVHIWRRVLDMVF